MNNKDADHCVDAQADLRLCCSHMALEKFSRDEDHLEDNSLQNCHFVIAPPPQTEIQTYVLTQISAKC